MSQRQRALRKPPSFVIPLIATHESLRKHDDVGYDGKTLRALA